MALDYNAKLEKLVMTYSGSPETGSAGSTVGSAAQPFLPGLDLADTYFRTFTTLHKDIMRVLHWYAQESKISGGVRYEFQLNYEFAFNSDKCRVGPLQFHEAKPTDSLDTISRDILGLLLGFKQHCPSFTKSSNKDGGKVNYIELNSPQVDVSLPQETFKEYRGKIFQSVYNNFRITPNIFQKDPPEKAILVWPSHPTQIENFIVRSYVRLESSYCGTSLWVQFEDEKHIGLGTGCRIFKSGIEQLSPGELKFSVDTPHHRNQGIQYLSPRLADKVVQHDSSDIGALLPVGLLSIAHLSMVKKILYDYRRSLSEGE